MIPDAWRVEQTWYAKPGKYSTEVVDRTKGRGPVEIVERGSMDTYRLFAFPSWGGPPETKFSSPLLAEPHLSHRSDLLHRRNTAPDG